MDRKTFKATVCMVSDIATGWFYFFIIQDNFERELQENGGKFISDQRLRMINVQWSGVARMHVGVSSQTVIYSCHLVY